MRPKSRKSLDPVPQNVLSTNMKPGKSKSSESVAAKVSRSPIPQHLLSAARRTSLRLRKLQTLTRDNDHDQTHVVHGTKTITRQKATSKLGQKMSSTLQV